MTTECVISSLNFLRSEGNLSEPDVTNTPLNEGTESPASPTQGSCTGSKEVPDVTNSSFLSTEEKIEDQRSGQELSWTKSRLKGTSSIPNRNTFQASRK